MSRVVFQLPTIVSRLENGHCLGRLLFFPQATAYGDDADRVRQELLRIAKQILPELPLLDLHRYRAAVDVQVREVTIEAPPPPPRWWSRPIPMRFHAICWDHQNQATIAYVPGLDIEVVASCGEDLVSRIADHVRGALMRREAIGCLRDLIWLQRAESVNVEMVIQLAEIPSARQVVERREAAPQKSVLRDVASHLTGATLPPVFELDDVSRQLIDWLYGDTPRSVLLVGPSGVGKTAAVYKLAGDGSRAGSRQRPLWSTSGARIVAGMCGFGMWQERCQALIREATASQIVVHLGNLMELLQVGQSEGNDMGVGEFLRPAIARGELLAIGECTPEELTLVERIAPGMLEAFVRLDMREPSPDTSKCLLSQAVDTYGAGKDLYVDETALSTLDRLHRRYATYSAYPGRPLRFLKNLMADAPRGHILTATDVTTAFSRETGLPPHLLEDSLPLDLAATRDWFAQRVVGQVEAVDLVVDLLATIKADLARPGRPLASLMFIGPTGVGKTEMAKTLAEFLYQDRQRLTRIDMSEYADESAIDRLIGTSGRSEGLLTSKVREQPFGVVLLDEFEKAHPRFFDLLLQVLGEGRLTDGAGRLADFRNSVIIMTSNLGAESFGRRAPGFGSGDLVDRETADHFTARAQDFLRPEMFNRIDRIVTFLPLSRTVLQNIARRELELLQQRDGVRYRSLRMEYDETLPAWLVDRCYDPRYGARPLKRAIERDILSGVAESLNVAQPERSLHIHISPGPPDARISVRHVSSVPRFSGTASLQGSSTEEVAAADACIQLRRSALRLQQCRGVQELRNDIYRLQRAKQRRKIQTGPVARAAPFEQDVQLAAWQALADRVDRIAADAVTLEDQVLGAWYTGQSLDAPAIIAQVEDQSRPLRALLLELLALQCERPNYITLVVYGENAEWRNLLAQSYYGLAAAHAYQVEVYQILSYSERPPDLPGRILLGDRDSKNANLRRQANETKLLAQSLGSGEFPKWELTDQATGIALCIRGPCSRLLFEPEEGLHSWQGERSKRRCLVHVSQVAMEEYQPPRRIDRREGIGNQSERRVWNRPRKNIDDKLSPRKVFWPSESLDPFLAALVEQHLNDRVEGWAKL